MAGTDEESGHQGGREQGNTGRWDSEGRAADRRVPSKPLPAEWDPDSPAVWREEILDASGVARAIMVRHPAYPFVGDWDGTTHRLLFDVAGRYLQRVGPLFGLPDNLVAADGLKFSDSLPGIPLAWLPITRGATSGIPDAEQDPRRSFFDEHYPDLRGGQDPAGVQPIDRIAVLFAVQSLLANDPELALHSRLGICVVAHVPIVASGSSSGPVRITGARCDGELAGTFRLGAPGVGALLGGREPRAFLQSFTSLDFKKALRAAAGGRPDQAIFIDGLRVRDVSEGGDATAGSVSMEVDAILVPTMDTPQKKDPRLTTAFRLTAPVSFPGGVDPWIGRIGPVTRSPLQAHAAPSARLFAQDPASIAGPGHLIDARPTRAPKRLEKYRTLVHLDGLTAGPPPAVLSTGDLKVTESRLVLSPGIQASRKPWTSARSSRSGRTTSPRSAPTTACASSAWASCWRAACRRPRTASSPRFRCWPGIASA